MEEYDLKQDTLYDQLWYLWKDYIDYFVVANQDLKKIFFHVFLGTVLTWKNYSYLESGEKKSLRMHFFGIQPSRTGKGQTMKHHHTLLEFIGVPSRYTTKDNESFLLGSVTLSKSSDNVIRRKGALNELFAEHWDEGGVLLKKSRDMDVIIDKLNMVMDEPGKVAKGMAHGSIDYTTNTTMIAGSYMFEEFKQTMMQKGFLQRMFIFFKDFTEIERREMRIGVNLLKLRTDTKKIPKIMSAIKYKLKKIDEETNIEEKIISFDSESVKKFNADIEKLHDDYISHQFSGEKQKTLETFFGGLHTLVDKMAAIIATMKGKDKVYYSEMKEALELCILHLNSLLEIFDYIEGSGAANPKEKREKIITDIIKKSDGKLIQTELLTKLRELKNVGKWDLGYNRSIDTINRMVSAHKISKEVGEKNAKILCV